MPSATEVSVTDYLKTVYRPDRDYLEGQLEERNVGEFDHGRLQALLATFFGTRETAWGIKVVTEQRMQVKPNRFRIPDLCVILGTGRQPPILTEPPFLCVEILSPEDRMSRMQSRIQDYLAFGVRYVWVIDPEDRWAGVYSDDGFHEVHDGTLRTNDPDFAVPINDLIDQI